MDWSDPARIVSWPSCRTAALLAWLLLSGIFSQTLFAQVPPPASEFREQLLLDTSSTVAKRLAAVRDYLPEGEWEQAIRIIRQIQADHGESIAAVSPGRYVSVTQYCQLLLTTLPPQALAFYRAEVDPQAVARFEEAVKSRDRSRLVELVHDSFASSVGDDALRTLAEWSFEAGDFASARHYWRQLLSAEQVPQPGTVPQVAHYPDSPIEPAEILARLVLCSICEGDLALAERQREVLSTRFPNAVGDFAGQSQNLDQALQTLIAQARNWPTETVPADWRTFAGNFQRNSRCTEALELQERRWNKPLPLTEDLRRSSDKAEAPLSFYPAVWNERVFIAGSDRILAYDLQTGQPAWPREMPADDFPDDGPADAIERAISAATIYPTGVDLPLPIPNRPVTGIPRYTVTIADGRLYARLGSIVTVRSRHEVRRLDSELVCLDVRYGQGRLVWRRTAEELSENDAALAFDGSPLVDGTAVYAILRKSFPDAGLSLVCFEAEDGRQRWRKPISSILSNGDQSDNATTHPFLTLAGDLLVVSTDLGAIAAVSRYDGRLQWIATYTRGEDVPKHHRGDPRQYGVTPCLEHRGTLFCAPDDADGIFALSAANAQLLWKRDLPDKIRHLLAAVDDRLVVAGNQLWCLSTTTGRVLWRVGYDDVEAYGLGRGLLVGENVYWPLRDRLLIVNVVNGAITQEVPLGTLYDATAGNLACADGCLLIAGPRRLTALGPFSPRQPMLPGVKPADEAAQKSLWLTRR